ncbi:MAG TPA: hypothetical protein VNZ53_56750 [Steroidobacteraceae bacterium]|jgi:hypothetical protein|nr:hypothetical protein [Steroidobacteraceae bacterium]
MRRYWIFRGVRMMAFAALVAALLGYLVMTLWNAVLPAATGLHAITFVQAVALLVLSRILFGGVRGWRRGGGHWRARMQARWRQMTPEERERFREVMQSRGCGRNDSSARTSQAQ